MFGRIIDVVNKVAEWGCRAIYGGPVRDCYIDLVYDRQSGEVSERFAQWINLRAIPWLRAEVKRIHLETHDPQVLTFIEGAYRLEASTNRSYGYLYIGAVQTEEDASVEPIAEFIAPVVPEECTRCGKQKTPHMRPFIKYRAPGAFNSSELLCASCLRTRQKQTRDNLRRMRERNHWA